MQRFLQKLPYIICYIIAFLFGMKQLREPDIWWQLLSGRWMLEHGAITRTDAFSYTMAGHKWINVKWLYEVIIATLEKGFGPEGVLLLQCLVNVGILWALFHTLKQMRDKLQIHVSDFFTIIAALLFFVVVEYRMTGRPEMVSHLMCALFLSYLWCYPTLKWKELIWPVVLQCLWANMHEGYPVGIVIIGTYAVGSFAAYLLQKNKEYLATAMRAGALLLLCIIAIAINPNGIQLWKQPFEIYRQVWANKYTTELYAYTDAQYWTIQAKIHIGILLAVIIFWIIRLIAAGRQNDKRFYTPVMIANLLLIPILGYLSLTANRNIPFAQIVCFTSIPYMAWWLADKLKLSSKPWYINMGKYSMALAVVIGFALYLSIVSNSYYKATKSVNKYGIHQGIFHNPASAVEFLKQNDIKGPAFSDYFISSYLLWAMYPDFKSYIDLRDLDIFPEKFFKSYFDLYERPEGFIELNKKYNFNYVIISTAQLGSLQRKLYWGEGYNQVYVDPVCVIFLKTNPENSRINDDWGKQKAFNWPQAPDEPAWAMLLNNLFKPGIEYAEEDEINAPVYSGRYYNEIGNYPFAIKQLAPFMYNLEGNAAANLALANSYLRYADVIPEKEERQRKLDSAQRLYERSLELDPENAAVYSGLANVSVLYNNYKDAVEYVEEYFKRDKTNDYVYYLGALCYRKLWIDGDRSMLAKMEDAMKRSLAINPKNNKAYLYLAEASIAHRNKKDAIKYLELAKKSPEGWVKQEHDLYAELKTKLGMK